METIFHAVVAHTCFKIFKLNFYLPAYTKITFRLIRILNLKKFLKNLKDIRNKYLMSRLEDFSK